MDITNVYFHKTEIISILSVAEFVGREKVYKDIKELFVENKYKDNVI